MPHNLVRLAVAAREAIAQDTTYSPTSTNSSDDEHAAPADAVEERWMRRLAAMLDAQRARTAPTPRN